MNDLGIGQLITTEQQRDAVHMAVAPATAGERLEPGERVGLDASGNARACFYKTTIGIVDPFLKAHVLPGQRFWLFLYPGSITSLRHDWTHPAFGCQASVTPDSESWIRSYAEQEGVLYAELMEAAAKWIEGGEYWYGGPVMGWDGAECGRFSGGEYLPDEFWKHYQAVTGTIVPEEKQESFFMCSC